MGSANQNLEQDVVVGNMLLQNFDFEVRQCCHELFIVQADSIVPRVAVPPRLVLILCILAERAQYPFKMMLIFESNMFPYECNACRFPIARNRCGCHVASDLDTIFLNHLPANFSVSTVAICWEPDDSHKLASQNVQSPGRTIELSDRFGNSEFSSIGQATAVDPGTPGNDHCGGTDSEDPPPAHPWAQNYDPTGRWWLSALLAALPVVVLLGSLALLHMKAHYSALLGLATSLICSIGIFGMPVSLAMKTAVFRRGLRLAANRLDHPQRHLHVSTHL